MKIFKIGLSIILGLPILYIIVSCVLSLITVNNIENVKQEEKFIFLSTNGVHLDIVIPKEHLNVKLQKQLTHQLNDNYFSFGWGDENFYLNTPTWNDLTFKTAVNALFLKSTSLMHVTRYKHKQKDWVKVNINSESLTLLNNYMSASFSYQSADNSIMLKGKGYSENDQFYKAEGSYSCFFTCNTWVNKAFKVSKLKCCYWTPFDFILLNKYK